MLDRRVVLGRIVGVFGVRGWVKVLSETDPLENILQYSPWLLSGAPGVEIGGVGGREVHGTGTGSPGSGNTGIGSPDAESLLSGWRVMQSQRHRKGLIVRLQDCDDRDRAQALVGAEIAVRRSQLPPPAADEFYWADLEGLKVETLAGVQLGVVDHLLSTGANDVLVVCGERERLIPFVWDSVIRELDFEHARVSVDWDPNF
nr:ribosome maturation factor RimM [Thiorhodovibrio winogradskyi]